MCCSPVGDGSGLGADQDHRHIVGQRLAVEAVGLRDEILQHPSYTPPPLSLPPSFSPRPRCCCIVFIDDRPMKLLRKLPPLDSRKVIVLSVSFLRKIPQDVYALLASHAWDDSVGAKVDQLHALLD